ncbi:AbrB family transcriptional regulator [Maritimibacter sp. HL-12]|jgi:uncharacterized protein|uniref:AbrB family transcriptional regulator n=1 Tax=Maritimibacter sp. HL-12 TaxID=1162418 RepID=UPI000A0F0604|nr:AbrB family transcriptional regulator [Maritimibacter sp. HL-12]SMH33963.1 hypothetical protein SAMN05661107_0486 [Maritimibacter sp. HL-12]
MSRPPASHITLTVLLLLCGAAGGWLLSRLGAPLPYMLGSLITSALAVALFQHRFPQGYVFSQRFRMLFVGVIGVLIGAQLTPAVAALLPLMLVSIPAMAVFVLGAHAMNYAIFRRLGGYDRATAYFAGSPGGLIESITIGEAAGADVRLLTLMQFLRIIAVVALVPVGMSIWEGYPVGSAAGQNFAPGAAGDLLSVALALALALAGVALGIWLRLPAGQLLGPLVLAGALVLTGIVDISAPPWLLAVAQVVLGTGLGMRFTGMTRSMLVKGTGLSLVSVAGMMGLGIALSLVVARLSDLPVDMLVVSFAPGGVVEMGLIALSIAANPAIVTLHHLVRIFLTVGELALVAKLRRF